MCKHPHTRLYSGTYEDPVIRNGKPVYIRRRWVGCLACGCIISDTEDRTAPRL